MSIRERLANRIAERGLDPEVLAGEVGMPASLLKEVNDSDELEERLRVYAAALAGVLQVSTLWLVTGCGDPSNFMTGTRVGYVLVDPEAPAKPK
jgi:hypothetical protein